jgi:hypothetical protein
VRSGVYAVLNVATRMAYIGSSVDVDRRLAYHRTSLASGWGTNRVLTAAYKQWGEHAFRFLFLEGVEPSDPALQSAEQRWMDWFSGRLYNVRARALRYPHGMKPDDVWQRLAAPAGETRFREVMRDNEKATRQRH